MSAVKYSKTQGHFFPQTLTVCRRLGGRQSDRRKDRFRQTEKGEKERFRQVERNQTRK